MRIPLVNSELVVEIDDEDAAIVLNHRWTLLKVSHLRYAQSKEGGKTILMHRLLANPGAGLVVDHINSDGLDNRRANLRICTQQENLYNRRVHKHSKTGVRGVMQSRNGFRASVSAKGAKYRKRFKTLEEAQEWAESLRKELHKFET